MELHTKRLLLRELAKKDLPHLVEYANNLNVSDKLASLPYPYRKKDGEWFINFAKSNARKKERPGYQFAIVPKDVGHFVGVIGLESIDYFKKDATIGYWLGEPHWRKGYITEATERLIRFAFNNVKLRRINIDHIVSNRGSERVIEKVGFTKEGIKRKYARVKATGKWHDLVSYGLLKEDWKRRK